MFFFVIFAASKKSNIYPKKILKMKKVHALFLCLMLTLIGANAQSYQVTENTKCEKSALVGKEIAQRALNAGINEVVFDRNGYLYHGRVKSLADAAREGGLKF